MLNKIVVHSNYHPSNPGGIEYVVSQLLEVLADFDCSVTCFYGSENNANIQITEKCSYVSRKILIKLAGACFLSFGNLSFFKESYNSKLLIFQDPYPTLWPAVLALKFLTKINIIVLIHANPVSATWIMRLYDRIRSIVFSGTVCVSTSPNILMSVNTSRFDKVHVIPLCILDNPTQSNASLDLPPRYVLYIGRMAQYKGLQYIIEAAILCPDVVFVLAGDGPLSSFVSNEIRTRNVVNIIFINRFVSETEKFELIERCQFVLFPSTSENEAFGLVQLEAMKSSKAIINTFLNSGVNYVAPHMVCALTIEKCNALELSDAIRNLWNDECYSRKLGVNGLARYLEMFSKKSFLSSWNNIIKSNLD